MASDIPSAVRCVFLYPNYHTHSDSVSVSGTCSTSQYVEYVDSTPPRLCHLLNLPFSQSPSFFSFFNGWLRFKIQTQIGTDVSPKHVYDSGLRYYICISINCKIFRRGGCERIWLIYGSSAPRLRTHALQFSRTWTALIVQGVRPPRSRSAMPLPLRCSP